MVKIRPEKFKAPVKQKRNRNVARVTNQAHIKLGLHASTTVGGRKAPKLARVQQEYVYEDIAKKTDLQSQNLLREAGVLPKRKETVSCWQCGATMSAASSSSSGKGQTQHLKQCPDCRGSGRHPLQLPHANLAWTPFWTSVRQGYPAQFNLFLHVLFLVSVSRQTKVQ